MNYVLDSLIFTLGEYRDLIDEHYYDPGLSNETLRLEDVQRLFQQSERACRCSGCITKLEDHVNDILKVAGDISPAFRRKLFIQSAAKPPNIHF